METTDLSKPLIISFIITFISSLTVNYFFGFEIALLFCISIAVAFIVMGFIGLENIIIINSKK